MFRTLIRRSRRLAGLTLLSVMAVAAASAQTKDKKATFEKLPERIVETDRARVKRIALTQEEQKKKYKGKKDQKKLAVIEEPGRQRGDQSTAGQQGIAVGEPNGGSYKKKELIEAAPAGYGKERGGFDSKQKEEAGAPQRQKDSGALPQKTKDAIGSPQKQKQKPETELLIEAGGETGRARVDSNKKPGGLQEVGQQAAGRTRGNEDEVLIAAPEEDKGTASDKSKKKKRKAKEEKIDSKSEGGAAPSLIKRKKIY